MIRLPVALACCVFLWNVPTRLDAQRRSASTSLELSHLRQDDDLWLARCEARCYDHNNRYDGCVDLCLNSDLPKFGSCPEGARSLLDTPCLKSCTKNSQCPGIDLCCTHHCGTLCTSPTGLTMLQTLPDAPTDVTIYRRRSKNITVWWNKCAVNVYDEKNRGTIAFQKIMYILQERHHIGPKFIESKLGEWQTRKRTKRTSVTFTRDSFIKPGRWYQFRVAAVNENGTKGFSEPTRPLKTRKPRPARMPIDLRAGPLRPQENSNDLLTVTFSWRVPRNSDLPVDKYKVYWSRRLPGVRPDLDSVLVSTLVVPQDQTSVQLKDLSRGSQYFLQVQALSQYGDLKIKGEKASRMLNTTIDSNNPISNDKRNPMNLKVKYYHKHRDLYATISWSKRKDGQQTTYFVKWSRKKCTWKMESHSVLQSTTSTNFELYGLHYNCQYLVQVTDSIDNTTARIVIGRTSMRKRRKSIR